jgi:hypothetical protein
MRNDDSPTSMRDGPSPRDWESIVLGRLRDRVESVPDDGDDTGWEAAALQRLREHFDSDD